MKRIIVVTVLAAALVAGWFAAGAGSTHQSAAAHASARASVYTCPMHPEYRSDHPGSCPVCGMALEVQHPHATKGAEGANPPGAVHVHPDRQQAIGVRVGVVNRIAATRVLRTTGRVAADENRTYPVVAAVAGWVRNVERVATGDRVAKDQVLASFLAPELEFRNAQQSYYTGLEAFYRLAVTESQPQSRPGSRPHAFGGAGGIDRMADELRIMGVSNSQLREMAARREVVPDIRVESPADGVVLQRNVSPGLRFDRGFEFYRIADLGHVWIVVDVQRYQLPFIRRGMSARITTAGGGPVFIATVSAAEPIFDEAAQTLKMRLEAANPQRTLTPGMFVDVEFPTKAAATIVVPADAIVDTGLRKTVFVDTGNGHFEPRLIETGWRSGDEVEVINGLLPGERIVIAGTFFIDSESRMKRPSIATP